VTADNEKRLWKVDVKRRYEFCVLLHVKKKLKKYKKTIRSNLLLYLTYVVSLCCVTTCSNLK
jgi:hypothetical protein